MYFPPKPQSLTTGLLTETAASGRVLSLDMKTLGAYLQTWNLKLSTTKPVSVVFHLYYKEIKRELEVHLDNEAMPICSKCLGLTSD